MARTKNPANVHEMDIEPDLPKDFQDGWGEDLADDGDDDAPPAPSLPIRTGEEPDSPEMLAKLEQERDALETQIRAADPTLTADEVMQRANEMIADAGFDEHQLERGQVLVTRRTDIEGNRPTYTTDFFTSELEAAAALNPYQTDDAPDMPEGGLLPPGAIQISIRDDAGVVQSVLFEDLDQAVTGLKTYRRDRVIALEALAMEESEANAV